MRGMGLLLTNASKDIGKEVTDIALIVNQIQGLTLGMRDESYVGDTRLSFSGKKKKHCVLLSPGEAAFRKLLASPSIGGYSLTCDDLAFVPVFARCSTRTLLEVLILCHC